MTRNRAADVDESSADTNLVILVGEVLTDPVALAVAGETLVSFDVRTRCNNANATVTVRASADGVSGVSGRLSAGLRVGVIGTVTRRFFVAGGRTQTRTDVHADEVVLATTAARLRKFRARGAQRLAA
jgi:hypothetical protein